VNVLAGLELGELGREMARGPQGVSRVAVRQMALHILKRLEERVDRVLVEKARLGVTDDERAQSADRVRHAQ
jgi:hypothetical protein